MLKTDEVRRKSPSGQTGQALHGRGVVERRLRPYVARIALSDAVAVAVAVALAYAIRFDANGAARVAGNFSPTYLAVSLTLFGAWTSALLLGRTYDHRILGAGPAEYHRVWSVSWRLGALVAIAAYMLRIDRRASCRERVSRLV